MFVDSHCHLDYPEFSEDFQGMLERASLAGISHMMTICTHVGNFAPVLKISQDHAHIFSTVGTHPHNVEKEPDISVDQLVALASDENVVGFGETGLDYFYEHSPRELQKRQFRIHIEAARKLDLPVIIHTRDAEEDTLAILEDEMAKGTFRALIHCFSASKEFAEKVLDLGLYISISGIVTFKKADDLRDAVKDIPLNRLLVETDAPYLAPIPHRGKSNEPAFTALTAQKLAEIKGLSLEEVGRQTTENYFTLFSKAKRG